MDTEQWKPVRFYENRYAISDIGRIKNINTDTILKPTTTKNGSQRICLLGNGYTFGYKHGRQTRKINTQSYEVGYLVLMAFKRDTHLNERKSFHLDGNHSNNKLYNLVWS